VKETEEFRKALSILKDAVGWAEDRIAQLEGEIAEWKEAAGALSNAVNSDAPKMKLLQARAEQAEADVEFWKAECEAAKASRDAACHERDAHAEAANQAEATTRRLEEEFEPYLKEGETPIERLVRERRDNDMLLGELAKAKTQNERLREALEAARTVLLGDCADGWKSPSVLAIDATLAGTEAPRDEMKTNVPNGLNTNPGDENY